MLKCSVNGRKAGSFEFTEKERTAFEVLRVSFMRAFILIHFKPDKPIRVEINILDFVIAGVLLQSENK
jgi:hypothetical protein